MAKIEVLLVKELSNSLGLGNLVIFDAISNKLFVESPIAETVATTLELSDSEAIL